MFLLRFLDERIVTIEELLQRTNLTTGELDGVTTANVTTLKIHEQLRDVITIRRNGESIGARITVPRFSTQLSVLRLATHNT